MSYVEKIFSRRSIRKYKNEPISDDVMHNILEAGRLSPSGGNLQEEINSPGIL